VLFALRKPLGHRLHNGGLFNYTKGPYHQIVFGLSFGESRTKQVGDLFEQVEDFNPHFSVDMEVIYASPRLLSHSELSLLVLDWTAIGCMINDF